MTTTPMADDTRGTATDANAAPQLLLPGPPPFDLGTAPRSALVLAAHPGDAVAGFALGIHRMQEAGWSVRILTLFDVDEGSFAEAGAERGTPVDSPSRAAQAAVEAAMGLLDRGRLTWRDHAARRRSDRAQAVGAAVEEARAHDVVVAPVDVGLSIDHRSVAQAVDADVLDRPVLRYLMPGQAVAPSSTLGLRRISAVRSRVEPLVRARAELLALMPCLSSTPAAANPRAHTPELSTVADLILV